MTLRELLAILNSLPEKYLDREVCVSHTIEYVDLSNDKITLTNKNKTKKEGSEEPS